MRYEIWGHYQKIIWCTKLTDFFSTYMRSSPCNTFNIMSADGLACLVDPQCKWHMKIIYILCIDCDMVWIFNSESLLDWLIEWFVHWNVTVLMKFWSLATLKVIKFCHWLHGNFFQNNNFQKIHLWPFCQNYNISISGFGSVFSV